MGAHEVIPILSVARHLLDFMVQGKITEADAPAIHLDATPIRTIGAPANIIPHFSPDALPAATIPICSGLRQAPINAGSHTQLLGLYGITCSGVLLTMEVGICKRAWQRARRYPASL